MTFRVYLRTHKGGVTDRTLTSSPAGAMAIYRELLARHELEGQEIAAVFSAPRLDATGGNSATYYSRFDLPFGAGRVAHDDPRLDPLSTKDEAERIMRSLPGRWFRRDGKLTP